MLDEPARFRYMVLHGEVCEEPLPAEKRKVCMVSCDTGHAASSATAACESGVLVAITCVPSLCAVPVIDHSHPDGGCGSGFADSLEVPERSFYYRSVTTSWSRCHLVPTCIMQPRLYRPAGLLESTRQRDMAKTLSQSTMPTGWTFDSCVSNVDAKELGETRHASTPITYFSVRQEQATRVIIAKALD